MLTALIISTMLAVILGFGTGLVACCAGIVHRRFGACSVLFLLRLSDILVRQPAHSSQCESTRPVVLIAAYEVTLPPIKWGNVTSS